MRTIEEINKDLQEAREELAGIQGGPAEVYSRIVGYYRSVRNWNKGKKEEYGERKLFELSEPVEAGTAKREGARGESLPAAEARIDAWADAQQAAEAGAPAHTSRLLLFVRPACPACPSAKAAAGKLGIPVDMVDADTEDGLAEAGRRNVFSTPTAILLSKDGGEITRALDGAGIAAMEDLIAG
jgi:ribonucleoside-triphosphate reductase